MLSPTSLMTGRLRYALPGITRHSLPGSHACGWEGVDELDELGTRLLSFRPHTLGGDGYPGRSIRELAYRRQHVPSQTERFGLSP